MANNRVPSDELVKTFAASTTIEEGLATYYLEQSGWNLQEAVNNFLDSLASVENEGSRQNPILVADDSNTPINIPPDSAFHFGSASHVVMQGCHQNLKLLSWNVDGLDERNIIERTRNVCHVINSRKPDVVFLQEVVNESLPIFQSRCSGYSFKYGSTQAYFNIMLLRNTSIKATDDLRCTFFQSSSMGRHLLQQSVLFNDSVHLVLMTSHLESTAQCTAERKKQLELVLTSMNQEAMHANVIFGGDTNLRDKEVLSIGGLPSGIVDAWEEIGKPEDAKYTWDITVNDNLDWKNRSKPRLRFDRLFLRPAQGPHGIKVVNMSLMGKERLPGCDRFASDHWGVWCQFAQLND